MAHVIRVQVLNRLGERSVRHNPRDDISAVEEAVIAYISRGVYLEPQRTQSTSVSRERFKKLSSRIVKCHTRESSSADTNETSRPGDERAPVKSRSWMSVQSGAARRTEGR